MPVTDILQELCERGQRALVSTDYLSAERTLLEAEAVAVQLGDFETLSRLYMPLQEARRQRRQRCGEGVVVLDLLETDGALDVERILETYPQGQLLVAGRGSIEPAERVRQLAAQKRLYVETFLAAVYPLAGNAAVMIVPDATVTLPDVSITSIDALLAKAPPHAIILPASELPAGPRKGTTQTFAETMAIWERLHAPFLAAADIERNLPRKIEAYRRTIAVDYGCELAHQKLSAAARELLRGS